MSSYLNYLGVDWLIDWLIVRVCVNTGLHILTAFQLLPHRGWLKLLLNTRLQQEIRAKSLSDQTKPVQDGSTKEQTAGLAGQRLLW